MLSRAAQRAPEALAPRVPWGKFVAEFRKSWGTGQHVTIVGSTGSGKSELLGQLARLRPYAVVFATKPKDPTMTALIKNAGFEKFPEFDPDRDPERHPRQVIWPDATKTDAVVDQARVFHKAFEDIYPMGGWSLFVDETWMFQNMLGLGQFLKLYLLQARSLDISLIMATQRPVSIPVEALDQSTWLFVFKETDNKNLDRLTENVSGTHGPALRHLLRNLEPFQFLAINVRTGQMWRSRVPAALAGK